MGGKERPEEPVGDEELVFMPVPSLLAILISQENEKGSALTEQEVLQTAGDCIGIVATPKIVRKMARSRGYFELDLDEPWEAWQGHVASRDAERTGAGDADWDVVTITGDIEVFLQALEHPPGHPAFDAAAAQVGVLVNVDHFNDVDCRYWSFSDGVVFMEQDGVTEFVSVQLRPDPALKKSRTYPRAATLIDGMSAQPDENEIRELLGTPEFERPPSPCATGRMKSGIRYEVSGGFVHFTLDDDKQVEKITVTATVYR